MRKATDAEGLSRPRDSLAVRERAFRVSNTSEYRLLLELRRRIVNLVTTVAEKPDCPQQAVPQTSWTGAFFGVHGIVGSGTMKVDETSAATGVTTFQSEDSAVGGGGGIQFGYGFAPFNNNVIVTPFVSADFLNLNVQHTFSPGVFYGQRTNFMATAGVDVGLAMRDGVQVFLRGGVGAVNQETKINFGGPVTTESDWKAGALVGGGLALNLVELFPGGVIPS